MFSFQCPSTLHFGRGQAEKAVELARGFGASVLIVHGANGARAAWLVSACEAAGLAVSTARCTHEPTLDDLDDTLPKLRERRLDCVIGLGGGSVMDFAKALAALIPNSAPPRDYLEVVGTGRALQADPLPTLMIPTTAGTGSEVTKNAVISVPDGGLKVSLRDPRMIPNAALVDPALMQGAPKRVVLAAALDAVTQVIEPYLSIKATPMSDALCAKAIPVGLSVLRDLVERDAAEAWDQIAWVSTFGGLALANAGLGAVHGFAGVIGGKTGAPHGEICGSLLPDVLASHLSKARAETEIHRRLMWVFGLLDGPFGNGVSGAGLRGLADWSRGHGLRRLEEMGLSEADHGAVAQEAAGASSMKGNPFPLSHAELIAILQSN